MKRTYKNVDGKGNVSYVEYEVEEVAETAYTAEQLEAMTSAELEAICAELGINPNKNKANMITLIMEKQNATLGE